MTGQTSLTWENCPREFARVENRPDGNVPPKQMYLSVAGRTIDRQIKAMKDEEVNITCHAIGSLPAANLSWRINNKLANFSSTYFSLKNKEGTFDAVSTIRFRPEPEHKEVDCVSTFNGSDEDQVARGILLVDSGQIGRDITDETKFQNLPLLLSIVSSFIASFLITLNCFFCLRRKFKASQSTNSRTDSDASLDYFAPDILTTAPDNALKEWKNSDDRIRPDPSKLQLHIAVPTPEESVYANCNTDIEELNIPEISINTDQPVYENYGTEPQKCKFPRISVIPENSEDNEYEIDITQLDFSKIPTITEQQEDLEYDELKF